MNWKLITLCLVPGIASASNVTNYFDSSTSGSGGGGSSPTIAGGTVTGANQFRDANGLLAGDDQLIDNNAGGLSAVLISATNVRGVMVSGTTLQQSNRMAILSTGSLSTQFQLNQPLGAFKFSNSTPTVFINMTSGSPNANGGMTVGGPGDPSATLHVVGTAIVTGSISSTTGYVHLGSPTTIPTCDATNKGNVFMNTTTNCLNYCDGTANRQMTSTAASCT